VSVDPLVGTWRLRSWISIDADGTVSHPMGDDAEGLLVYTVEGAMITTIGSRGRPRLATDDVTSGSADERLAAAGSFIAYSGRYDRDGTDVIHHVEMSLFPNWVGGLQVRHVTLSDDGETLTLSSEPLLVNGRLASQRLTWHRLRDDDGP
jgi:hypothetical protein